MQVVVQRLPKNTIKITVTLDPQEIKTTEEKVWDEITSQAEIDGFRKGKAPLEIVKQKTDINKVKAQIISELIKTYYPKALEKENLKPVIEPKIEIESFDPEKNLTFTATTALKPQITLGDYKKAVLDMYNKKLQEFKELTQKHQNQKNAQKENYAQDNQNAQIAQNSQDHQNDQNYQDDQNGQNQNNQANEADQNNQNLKENEDGNQSAPTQQEGSDGDFYLHTNEIVEAITSVASGEISDLLIEEETNKMLSRLINQLQALRLNVNDYLKTQNKTPEQLRGEYQQIAEKQLLAEFALLEAVKAEKVSATDEEVSQTIKAIGDEKLRQQYEQNDFQKEYVRAIIAKNKLLWQLNEYAKERSQQTTNKENKDQKESSEGQN